MASTPRSMRTRSTSTSRRLARSTEPYCEPRFASGCRGSPGVRPAAACSRSTAVLRHFSQRRAEIEARARELVGAGAEVSREAMQGIALATRRAKEYDVDGATWRERAQARAAEHGFVRADLEALQRCRPTPDAHDLTPVFSRLSGPRGLTETHNTFARRHAMAEIAGTFAQGASAAKLELATSRYLNDDTVRQLRPDRDAGARYTTVDLLAREHEIIDGAERRNDELACVLLGALVDQVLSRAEPALNTDQATAVRALASSRRGIDVVEALAGTARPRCSARSPTVTGPPAGA